jgi:hypothetical protein
LLKDHSPLSRRAKNPQKSLHAHIFLNFFTIIVLRCRQEGFEHSKSGQKGRDFDPFSEFPARVSNGFVLAKK